MKHIKRYKIFESVLLQLENNVDRHLTSIIQDNVSLGSDILEISCGNGADSKYLQDLGYRITCTELDDVYVNNAKNLGLNCIKHNTKNRFPFKSGQFDLIYSRLGLHYFNEEELNRIFSELSRIGDKLLITVKVEEDSFNTGKVILSPEKWNQIISKYFDIIMFNIKEGLLYGKPSKWIEILAEG